MIIKLGARRELMKKEIEMTIRQKETEKREKSQTNANEEDDKDAKRLAKLKEERCHLRE